MADHNHRHLSISLPPRTIVSTTRIPGSYSSLPYPLSTPVSTPSKNRLSSSFSKSTARASSLSFLFLLFSLRSLYSLLPFLRSSPSSFSLFPFSFIVSLLSFLLTLAFSFLSSFSASTSFKDLFRQKQSRPSLSLMLTTKSQHRLLMAKSLLLAVVFLLRFQALRYCGAAAMILAELSGNLAARFVAEGGKNHDFVVRDRMGSYKVRGFCALLTGLFLLSISWDRIECFPLSSSNLTKFGLSLFPGENCVRIRPLMLPFFSGFLGSYERISMNWSSIRELGQRRIRLLTLFFTTAVLFIPAVISMFVFEAEGDSISIGNLGWPLANTVLFGVLLSENYVDQKLASSKDFEREFIITFVCTLILELFYFPELSLWGLLLCGFLLWMAVRELIPVYSRFLEVGLDSCEPFTTSIMKPVRQILSERKSRKIALFLLINTAYMIVEFVAGFMSNSLGLISDACHMLFDCAALALGLYASYISRLPANSQFNYGRGRFEVLSGYVNAVFLVLIGALIVLESFERILEPQEISTGSLMAVSLGGLLVNVVGLIFFHDEHHHAHGGVSCSHSHHHSHDHIGHDKVNEKHECITVVNDGPEISSSGHDYRCRGDHKHHDCQNDYQVVDTEDHESSIYCHGHKDHDHRHQHDHHHHNHRLQHAAHHVIKGIPSGSKSLQSRILDNQKASHSPGYEEPVSYAVEPRKYHHHIDHNMEGIFLHVLADTMGSVGVVISTLLIKYKGWLVADPACSIFISILIVSSVIPLLRNSAEILLQRVPRVHEQELTEAVNDVMKIKGACSIQNLHIWSSTNTHIVGTLKLHVSTEMGQASVKAQVSHILHNVGIKDLTIQVERVE